MITTVPQLIDDFRQALPLAARSVPRLEIGHRADSAPHRPPALPFNKCAVYVFSLSEAHGGSCPAGGHRVLQVGTAAVDSGSRFQFQHYNARSAPATLAALLVGSPILWRYLGIDAVDDASVGQWIKERTDRDSFFVGASHADVATLLERYLKGRLGPVFESD